MEGFWELAWCLWLDGWAPVGSPERIRLRSRSIQVAHHADGSVPDFPRIEKVVRILRRLPRGRLLDVGYQKGSFADDLAREGWACTGLDLTRRDHPQVKTIQCDIEEGFPVESGVFDVVTAGEVIEHMLDEAYFLQECHRVLKEKGLLVLTTPNLSFLLNRILVPLGQVPLFVHAPYHYHFHTKRTLTRLLQEGGFCVERILASHILYSRRRHATGKIFEWLGDIFPTFGAHLIVCARRC